MRTNEDHGTVVRVLEGLLACHDLPEVLPNNPMPILVSWFEDAMASERYDDFNAMTLASATADGQPSARIVLCKSIESEPPALVFYTGYESRKGIELESNPHAAALFHWPHAKRQARIEGPVRRTTDAESDAYFRSRSILSRIGACVSPQSREIESRQAFIAAAVRLGRRAAIGEVVARPAHWGGYRIAPERIELWSARKGRLHDRAVWQRDALTEPDTWTPRRLGA